MAHLLFFFFLATAPQHRSGVLLLPFLIESHPVFFRKMDSRTCHQTVSLWCIVNEFVNPGCISLDLLENICAKASCTAKSMLHNPLNCYTANLFGLVLSLLTASKRNFKFLKSGSVDTSY